MRRCWWAGSDELYRAYHDREWGRPSADDRRLFEKLCLEGFMSGLSWLVVLRKRPSFRAAFRDFDPRVVARFGARDVTRLMNDAGIVRNRAKIEATINNARRYAEVAAEFGSLGAYVWSFAPKRRRSLGTYEELIAVKASDAAVALSRDLRRRGWAFVGPTTVHSFMQAMGLLNDHVRGCAAGVECLRERESFTPPG